MIKEGSRIFVWAEAFDRYGGFPERPATATEVTASTLTFVLDKPLRTGLDIITVRYQPPLQTPAGIDVREMDPLEQLANLTVEKT